ncbi:UNVERIFIED_CONTAM: hypothetical protein Slati_2892900 [Sesamum latifolium]|uniref:Uncharacterized protein n=1 Tax=Sesamum latifolium TaxID=2727402 RepID=A0AAW2VHM3_9LAMI
MSSGTPPVPRGRGRGRGRGPPLPAVSSDASRIGGAVSSPSPPPATTPPSPAPQTHLAGPSTAASAFVEACMQFVVLVAGPVPPPPPPAVHPPSTCQYISLDDARSDRRFHERINTVVRGHFPHPWPYLRQITYWWDCDDKSMFRVFHMFSGKYIRKTFAFARSSLVKPLWLANEIWLQLQAYWASEGFQQESSKNKANRAVNPTASSIVYRGGSSSVCMHKRKLEAELGRPPKQMEVFERCYKKKEDGGCSGTRAAEVAVMFQKLMEDHRPQPTAVDGHTPAESEASVADVAGCSRGKNKGHVFGLGSEAHFSSWTYTSSSPPPPPPPPPNPA